jgi:SAM-dependent methyltransferase
MTPQQFKEHLDTLPYDKFCQDIEYCNLIGHSKSHITWDLMRDMFPWEGKHVADLGCFHGYYCFKAEQEGAIVTGFDRAPIVLATASKLRDLYNSKVLFTEWSGGMVVPKQYDIALLLSVLYFFPDREKAIQNIKCKYLLCDVGNEDFDLIKKYYRIMRHKKSWGIGERSGIGNLMLCERKDYE